MSQQFGKMIAASAKLALGYIDRLTADIPEDAFGKLATAGDQTVDANHPAFIFGHLALYPSRIVADLGGDASAIAPTDADNELFSPAAKCVDDSDGTRYPSKEALLEKTRAAYHAAIEALESADDEVFAKENPNERMREKFPTIGAMHAFYVGGHTMMHIGQLSTWRRVMGMGPA